MSLSPIEYEEPFYRPPAESGSVLLQLTVGCSHNRCLYCAMYRHKEFRVRPAAALAKDCRNLAAHFRRIGVEPRKVFLGDGDALAAPMDDLRAVLNVIRSTWPAVHRIGIYLTAANVLEKSEAELAELAALGLRIGYLGLESGSDEVLKLIVKGNTARDMLDAAAKLDRAGWQLSLIGMLGVGGRELSAQHTAETARIVTEIAPRFFSVLTTVVVPGTPFERAVKRGKIDVLSVRELLQEARGILTGLTGLRRRTIFRANHVSNLLPLEGILPRDIDMLTTELDRWISSCPPNLYPEISRDSL